VSSAFEGSSKYTLLQASMNLLTEGQSPVVTILVLLYPRQAR
jgi:hypothetical protein